MQWSASVVWRKRGGEQLGGCSPSARLLPGLILPIARAVPLLIQSEAAGGVRDSILRRVKTRLISEVIREKNTSDSGGSAGVSVFISAFYGAVVEEHSPPGWLRLSGIAAGRVRGGWLQAPMRRMRARARAAGRGHVH